LSQILITRDHNPFGCAAAGLDARINRNPVLVMIPSDTVFNVILIFSSLISIKIVWEEQ